MTSIYDLSWGETSFLAKLKLFVKSQQQEKEKIRSSEKQVQAGGYSALSSTYYSIVGSAFSQLKVALYTKWFAPIKIATWCFTWLLLASWCYWRILPLSNHVVKLIGYDGMSTDQCDVRQSILRRRGRYDEAKKCIDAALSKNPKAHTRGLLHIGLAEIYCHKEDWNKAKVEIERALDEATEAEKQYPRQAARIYRHYGNILDLIYQGDPLPGTEFRRKALKLAREANAGDQLLKLKK